MTALASPLPMNPSEALIIARLRSIPGSLLYCFTTGARKGQELRLYVIDGQEWRIIAVPSLHVMPTRWFWEAPSAPTPNA